MGLAAKPPPVAPPVLDPLGLLLPKAEGGPASAWTSRATARGPPLDA
jgi:hypothetical protein